MCCFSRHVEAVWDTRIFARRTSDGGQALAYAMGMAASESLAMVLPLPVPPRSADDAVRFVSLHGGGKDHFFGYLDSSFPIDFSKIVPQAARAGRADPLVVHAVGAFVASFVPSPADFARLDPRFRMPDVFWSDVREYQDWGFAVFQLRAADAQGPGSRRIDFHPMAFTFPTRERDRLFFPTLHVHDGRVHRHAPFDHTLYAQGAPVQGWEHGGAPHPNHVSLLAPMLEEGARLSRTKMKGSLPNRDTWIAG
jgi:hypothetical protein